MELWPIEQGRREWCSAFNGEPRVSKTPRVEIKMLGIYVSGEGLAGIAGATLIVIAILFVCFL